MLVVGGGPAGLTCATYLRRAGVEVEVSEISRDTGGGAGLGLSSNALMPLRELGLLEEILACSTPIPFLLVCDDAGNTIVDVPRPGPEDPALPVDSVIARKDLARILEAAAHKAGVRITVGRQILGLSEAEKGVTVRFDEGPEARYDAVIGADGIGSTVRRLVWGPSEVQSAGEAGWRWLTPARSSLKRGTFHLGSGGTNLGLFPIPGGRLYAAMGEPIAKSFNSTFETRRDDVERRLKEQFTGDFARDTLADLPPASQIHYSRYPAMLIPRPWHRGRVLLIGDAVHAMPPHSSSGAAMAIEDGAVLYQELQRASNWEEAMQAFTERRWRRVKPVFDLAVDRVRSNTAPQEKTLRDPRTIEKVKALWQLLLQDY